MDNYSSNNKYHRCCKRDKCRDSIFSKIKFVSKIENFIESMTKLVYWLIVTGIVSEFTFIIS